MSLHLNVTIIAYIILFHLPTLIHTSLVFFPSTVQAWNNLPTSLIEIDSLQYFISNLNQYL